MGIYRTNGGEINGNVQMFRLWKRMEQNIPIRMDKTQMPKMRIRKRRYDRTLLEVII